VFRHVLRFFALLLLSSGCALVTSALPSTASAQDEEQAGHSRGGYAWGEEHHEEQASGPAVHRYGRAFVSLGAGGSIRIIQYEDLVQERFAPSYLQLRGGWFFEGDGMFQHGVVLGVGTPLSGDGTEAHGVSPFGQYSLAPSYMLRIIPDGDLGNWFQATGRIGIPLSVGEQFSWGWEAGIGMLVKPLEGFGIYGEIGISQYFANDLEQNLLQHPLLSFEIGLAVDYEVLP
jgi:hypothetical protein